MTIFFDCDGTIADLYGVKNWKYLLDIYDPTPYRIAAPLCDFEKLTILLNKLQEKGYKIGIISWLSKNSNIEYSKKVRQAKKEWLKENFNSIKWDEIHIIKYGTPKQKFCKKNDVLFDDEENNRKNWKGIAYEPSEIFKVLENLI